ncbi:MAG: outer membrane beta-barrel protein [Ekhidna sp.]|uniref:outer membrane beta-barrel protein n=1 Tax=Ekhidna sp. TaxID=2608089 RepID=UPI0032EF301C
MDRERFEDRIRDKFEGQTVKAPSGTWSNIESALNADLVSRYEAQHMLFKWMAVAAVFVIVFFLGILYFPFSGSDVSPEDYQSYNALLSKDWNTDNYFDHNFSTFQSRDLTFKKISGSSNSVNSSSNEMLAYFEKDETVESDYEEFIISKKSPGLELATVSSDIYWYRAAGPGTSRKSSREPAEKKVWAGVEAGAGTFSSNISGSSALASSLNPAGIASAVGTEGFINPTTSISSSMNEGLATSIGVDFGVQLGKKWTLESGLAYTRMNNSGSASINVLDVFTIDSRELVGGEVPSSFKKNPVSPPPGARETVIEVEESYDHEVELNNNVQLASIPLKAGYYVFDRKFSLRLNAGLAANYLINGSLSDPSRQVLDSDNLNLYNDWSFDGIGGLELGYSILSNFAFTIEPNYRHAITPISNSTSNPSRLSIQTGLRYTMK